MNTDELRQMPVAELRDRRAKLREEIFNLRFKAVTEPITDPAGLRKKRRLIAVISTLIGEKQRAETGATPSRKLSREQRKLKRMAAERVAGLKRRRAQSGRKV